jgi:hypothetical protein
MSAVEVTMVLNIELSPETEARLISAAEARGISLEAYIRVVVGEGSRQTFGPIVDESGFRAALDALTAYSGKIPQFSTRAFVHREDIYQGDD